MADGVVKFTVDKLEELAQQEMKLQSEVGKKVRELKDELEWLRTFLRDADCRRRKEANEYIELWVRQTREVAFDAEDLLEEHFHRGRLHCRNCLDVPSLLRWVRDAAAGLVVRRSIHGNIGSIQDRLRCIDQKREQYELSNQATTSAPPRKYYTHWSALQERDIEEHLVGIRENFGLIQNWLHGVEKRRTVIAITGKSGAGKTALANKIYGRSFVRNHFNCLIWVHVPQKFKLMDVLSNILQQASGASQQETASMTEEDMERELSLHLRSKHYLIVLDDVRSWEECKFLLAVLPDSGREGNRVLVTTQLSPPAVPPSSSDRPATLYYCHHALEVKKLNRGDRKELFCRRVFGRADFPEGFHKPAGLDELLPGTPVAVVLLAGLLRSKMGDEWPDVIKQLRVLRSSANEQQPEEQIAEQPQQEEQLQPPPPPPQQQPEEQISEQPQQEEQPRRPAAAAGRLYKQRSITDKILTMSFDDLPPQLKSCFLYFSAFQAETEISSAKLVRLWIAEGFVQPTEDGTMEEVGQEYLKKLVSRCLVNLVEMDYNSNIVTVHIHDRLLGFARSEARDTNFLQVRNSTANYSHASIRRLSLQNTFDAHISLDLAAPKLRSLFCTIPEARTDDDADADQSSSGIFSCADALLRNAQRFIKGGPADSFTIYRSKFLRVVELKGVQRRGSLPKEIGWLIHLRYLGLAHTGLSSLPSSIKKLRNLQTLNIADTKVDAVPRRFWKIRTLRHVLARDLSAGPGQVEALVNLQTLHGVPWGRWARKGAALKRMTNLRSLQLRNMLTAGDGEALMAALTSLECLRSLDLTGACLPLKKLLTKLGLRHLQYLRLHGQVEQEEEQSSSGCRQHHQYQRLPDGPDAAQGAEQSHYYLLPNLAKLELYESEASQAHISMIEKLPNLIELVLGEQSYRRDVLAFHDGGLPALRKLQLRKLEELEEWRMEGCALPQLEDLSVVNCRGMRRVRKNEEELSSINQLKEQLPSLKQFTVDGTPLNLVEQEQQSIKGRMEIFCKEMPSRKRLIA